MNPTGDANSADAAGITVSEPGESMRSSTTVTVGHEKTGNLDARQQEVTNYYYYYY